MRDPDIIAIPRQGWIRRTDVWRWEVQPDDINTNHHDRRYILHVVSQLGATHEYIDLTADEIANISEALTSIPYETAVAKPLVVDTAMRDLVRKILIALAGDQDIDDAITDYEAGWITYAVAKLDQLRHHDIEAGVEMKATIR